MSALSPEATAEVFAQEGGGFLVLMTIDHPDLAEPIRVVNNTVDIVKHDPAVYTFTRASVKNVPNADASLIEYAADAPARSSLGINLEPTATNLMLRSDVNASWAAQGDVLVVDAAKPNPFGVAGDVRYPTTSERFRSFNADGASRVRVSFWGSKRVGSPNDNCRIQFFQSTSGTVVTLDTYDFALYDANPDATYVKNVERVEYANDWVRFEFDVFANAGAGTGLFTASARFDMEGGISENYIYGIQCEADATKSSSYVRSAAVAGVRAADVLTLTLPPGSHTITATFDDDSTQVLASGVSGTYEVDPAALNRPLVKSISAGSGALWDFAADHYQQNGDLFIAYPFELTLPDDRQGSAPRARLVIDNVSREIAQLIRSINTPPSVAIEVVRIDDTDSVEISLPMFRLRNVTWNVLSVSGDLTIDEIEREPFPQRRFTPAEYPGLF